MIRVDAAWLAVEPLDMRAGTDTALARVIKIFGAAHPHHAYLFANRRANRIKVLVHDGIGISGNGKTHRAYLWAYCPGAFEDLRAVVFHGGRISPCGVLVERHGPSASSARLQTIPADRRGYQRALRRRRPDQANAGGMLLSG